MPKVSIVMPCFNQEAFVVEALQSVRAQTYADWECIVVDDGSTDRSAQAVREFIAQDTRFSLIQKPNGGVASARNLGIARSTGTYIVPLDSDDTIGRDYLRHAVDCFTSHPDTELVHPRTVLFGDKRKTFRLHTYSYAKLLWKNMLVNTCMYTRAAFERTSGYSEAMVHGYEDWELYIRMLNHRSEVRYAAGSIFRYRIKEVSRRTEHIADGKVETSLSQIFKNNRQIYLDELADPIIVFDRRMQEFSTIYSGKYKRQVVYLHAIYFSIVVALLGLLFL